MVSAMRRVAMLSICLGLLGTLGAPAGAMGDGVATGSADVAVSVSVLTQDAGGQWTITRPDPSAPLLVGDSEQVRAAVTNAGPDPSTVTLRLTETGVGGGAATTWTPWSGTGFDGATRCGQGEVPLWCTFTIPAGGEWDFYPVVRGRLPGAAGITFTATGTAADPDPNNSAAWSAPVSCQVMGTPGDDRLMAGPGQAACGLGGDDTLIAEPGALALAGGDGNDTLVLGQSTEALVSGGDGIDTASYANAPNAVMVCPQRPGPGLFSGGMSSPEGGGATIWGVENITGSAYGDRLLGTGVDNVILGGGGSDWIGGGGGNDELEGGLGNDLFRSTDHTRDTVLGGRGHDRADVDRADRVTSATDVSAPPYNDPCLA
jgi:Ca2+-binding RTX toxin-like protein